MKKFLFSGIASVIVLLIAVAVVLNFQLLKDHYVVATNDLQPASAQILDDIALTEKGEFLYKASRPMVQSAQEFRISCRNASHEHSIVLGCYTRQQLFVYDVTDPRLEGVKQVTAAHELLHAVYERMSVAERQSLSESLKSTAASINDTRFQETIEEYRRADASQLENELHSILGTEIAVLPDILEQHYSKYLSDRQKIVGYAKQYEAAFTTIDAEIKQYDTQMQNLQAEKQSLETTIAQKQAQITAESARLDSLRGSDPEQYNQRVPGYNSQIQSYNSDIERLRQIVATYNDLVEKRNALAVTQNDLVQQLDSDYQPL